MADTVLIADDHSLFRTGLKHLVSQLFQDPEVLEATNYSEAVSAIQGAASVNLILMDLRMPEMDGFQTLGNLVREAEGVPVVVLSSSSDINDMRSCFDAGVMGYVPKKEPSRVILSALRLVLSGGIYVPSEFISPPRKDEYSDQSALVDLTDRQREVLNLLAEGESNKEIARNLNVTEATVKAHLAIILRLLGAKNRTQAVVYLQRMELS